MTIVPTVFLHVCCSWTCRVHGEKDSVLFRPLESCASQAYGWWAIVPKPSKTLFFSSVIFWHPVTKNLSYVNVSQKNRSLGVRHFLYAPPIYIYIYSIRIFSMNSCENKVWKINFEMPSFDLNTCHQGSQQSGKAGAATSKTSARASIQPQWPQRLQLLCFRCCRSKI